LNTNFQDIMTIRFVEARNDRWDEAADGIIKKLSELKVEEGQVLTIDAHNSGDGTDARFSAFWDDTAIGKGPLNISYEAQRDDYNASSDAGPRRWIRFYEKAAKTASTIRPEDLISITGSCNFGRKSVMYVFFNSNSPATTPQEIHYCEVQHDNSWDSAAKELISKMKNNGAKAGQVISIDAHSNGRRQDPIFHAFWNSSLPVAGQGELEIEFDCQNSDDSWDKHYRWGTDYIGTKPLAIHGITSSCNSRNRNITYVFHEPDEVVDVKFFVDEGRIVEQRPKVLGTFTNKNESSVQQELRFQYEKSVTDSSSFTHEAGVEISFGTTIETGIPFLAKGEITAGLSTSYNHTWGQTTEINERAMSSVFVRAGPNTEVTCQFRATQTQMNVPFLIKLKSNREVRGTWTGVNLWDLSTSFDQKEL